MRSYKTLNETVFTEGNYSLVPIRKEDKYLIMQWRNEQIFHLRQAEPLTKEKQENYFRNVVDILFEQEKPSQLLFSYLENGICIGYGGLVHINWMDKNAEISFLLATENSRNIEKHCFLFKIYLDLIQKVGFDDLKFHRLHAEVYDTRPYHTNVMENCGFLLEGRQREHILIENNYVDSLIYGKLKKEYGH